MSTAEQLLNKVLEAHGGLNRWHQVRALHARVSAGGFGFALKLKATLRGQMEVSTSEPRTVFSPYPYPGQRGVFEARTVRIESSASGVTVARRDNPRQAFSDLRHKFWWDHLDLLYFAGYAGWNYLSTPFLFMNPGFEVQEIESWMEKGETWRRLQVRFPPELPTHSAEQVCYFDQEGLLRRLDYTAEVFGSWAKAAHYFWEHKAFSGLVVPTRRRVFLRKNNGQIRPHPVLVWIELEDVTLNSSLL